MDEGLIEMVCNVRWPAQMRAGTFQKTIGRVAETPKTYQMPSFPLSLLHDPDAFDDFCRPHLTELQTQVRESWEAWFDVECKSEILRQTLPTVIPPVTGRPFTADQLVDAAGELRVLADVQWINLQAQQVAEIYIFKSRVGMMSHAVHDLYKSFWGNKDRSLPDFETADDRLRESYLGLARSRLSEGDEAMAAEYSKVAFDLSDAEVDADDIKVEFIDLIARWDEIAAAKENAVKRVATVAREGGVEWWSLMTDKCFRKGQIHPITRENREYFSSSRREDHRKKLKSYSAGNPYRKGLELMEKVEAGLGFWAARHGTLITEWPLEQLRRRVPTSVVEQARRGSLWTPDTRLMQLSGLSHADVRPIPFTGGIMPLLRIVHDSLDNALPGILTHALDQLPDS